MPAKRKKPAETCHGATADPVDQTQSIDGNPPAKSTQGLKSSLHGNVFQLKLLVLFLIRGIKAKYQFKLGTEIPGMGGKFDDLIFKYEVMDEDSMTQEFKTERYRYLQAKHKQNEDTEKITAAELLNDNNGEFSLPKYFRSYYLEVINGIKGRLPYNVRDCIICTNVGFDDELKLKEAGIELLPLDDKDEILTFDQVSDKKSPSRYKLKKTDNLLRKMLEWSDIHLLAKTLFECVAVEKQLALTSPIFKNYHYALVNENVIDKEKGKLCSIFLEGNSRFRKILSEVTFVNYWKKLNFKYDDTKKIRVDNMKTVNQFEEISLENLLPKYPSKKTESMKMDFRVFEDFYDDFVSEKIIDAVGRGNDVTISFTAKFIEEKVLSEKGSEFRGKLRNVVFIHFWKDLTFSLSETFGRKIINSTPEENKSLNDFVGEKEIGNFLDKLVFAVHTPNEVELDGILKREVSDRYSLHESDFQSDFILRNMLDWFKKKESQFMTSADGIDILENAKKKMKSLRLTAVSIDYQRKLKKVCGFNEESIREMAEKLNQLLISENKVERIISKLPKRTAVKVIAALKKLRQNISHETARAVTAPEETYFKGKDSYLVAPLFELKNNYEKLKETFTSDIISHHLLIVIYEKGVSIQDEKYCEELVKGSIIPKKVIFISNDGAGIKDDLKFNNFSNKFKQTLLSKQVLFQGTTLAVVDLIKRHKDQTVDELIQSGEPEQILNLDAIEELMKQEKSEIQIPSLSSSRFEKSLYIKRQLSSAFPLDNEMWEEVAKELDSSGEYSLEQLQSECRVSHKGEIEWNDPIVNYEQKIKIWEKMNSVLEKRKSLAVLPSNTLTEDDLSLVDRHGKETNPEVVIIAGVAGSGKSSILSHYYEEIKEKDPNHWVIVINFTDHSKDFLKLNSYEVNLSTTIDCLLNLSVVVGNSRFGLSMLRRRLLLGDRITILFDGFDEIVKSQYQETAIRVIQVLKENKSAGLYVTTRSHMANNLQFRLSQLNYDLENFSKEDQINYLTSLWKRNFSNDAEDNLRHFAKLLVDRISKTLKDGERAFIGIPLQCRILAECFETDVQNSAQNQSELNSLVESIDQMNLDVANLYRLLITKKRRIYEEEKKALSQSHDLADDHAISDIDNLESFLRKLAIKTIVSTKEEVHVLLGTQEKSMKSKNEQDKKIKKRMDHSARFGLLDENAEGKERFLHRTYAEYMMAEYLYTGFLLDDDKRNQLLDFDSARKLIIDTILVKEQYDGVQVFFNSMLKEIVDRNKEWRESIIQGKLPERLFKLAEDLYRQSLRQNQKPNLRNPSNALRVSVINIKEEIFNFLCDCLDATFDKSTVSKAVTISFLTDSCGFNFAFSLKLFRHQRRIFRRFIGYYRSQTQSDDTTKETLRFIIKLMKGLPLSGLDECSEWNGSEQTHLIDDLLDFMLVHQKAIDPIFRSDFEHYMEPLFAMIIFNENYDSHIPKLLKILSNSKFYSSANNFSDLLKNVLQSVKRKRRPKDRIGKAITILQALGRQDVLHKMYGLVITMDPDAFQSIYHPSNHYTISQLKTNLSSWLEPDSYRMTHIHRAAFHGDTAAIEKIQTTVKEILIDEADPELREKAEQVVKIMSRDVFGFTPFYLAAACGHENLYRNMLAFLKDVTPGGTPQQVSDNFQTYLTATDGFVFHALSDAMESENLTMFQTILNAVKTVLGQQCLLHLLKSKARENKGKIRYDHYPVNSWPTTIFGVASRYAELFHSLAKIVVHQEGGNENYQDFDDLVFNLLKTEDFYHFTLKHVNAEILQGMLSLKGSDDWTKRLLDMDGFLVDGFDLLSNKFIKNFQEDQLKQFIEVLILDNKMADKNLWSKIIESAESYTRREENLSLFLKCVSEKLGESFAVKLITHENGHVTICSDKLTNCMFAHLSMEGQEEVRRYWKQIAAPKINEIFFEPTSKHFWLSNERKFRNAEDVTFYLEYGSDAQLSDFVRVVTSLHDNVEENKQCSVWGYVFKHDSDMKWTTRKILKHVAEKEAILGRNATKTLLLHKIDEEPLLLEVAASWEDNVDSLLPEILIHLPNEIQDEMQQYLREHGPKLVDKAFSNLSLLMPYDHSYIRLNSLICLLDHCNENQLQLFFEKITFLQDASHTVRKTSIWGDLFGWDCKQEDVTMMDKFLRCVSEKLGSKTVKKLVLHADEGKDAVILHTASRGADQMVETMLNYLDVEDRQNVQRKVDKYLRKKFQAPDRKSC